MSATRGLRAWADKKILKSVVDTGSAAALTFSYGQQ
jgi:hypothetical protein